MNWDRVNSNYRKSEMSAKKLDCIHDLSKGERQYLARKGITGKEFDSLPAHQQQEWKEEMKAGHYAKNDKDYGTVNHQFRYF